MRGDGAGRADISVRVAGDQFAADVGVQLLVEGHHLGEEGIHHLLQLPVHVVVRHPPVGARVVQACAQTK